MNGRLIGSAPAHDSMRLNGGSQFSFHTCDTLIILSSSSSPKSKGISLDLTSEALMKYVYI
jgi:hypothetical protein